MRATPRGASSGLLIRVGSVEEIETLCEIDTDASALFEHAGLFLDLPRDHEFAVAERQRWQRSLAAGAALLAADASGRALGFAACATLDGQPYLDQLSVRTDAMRRGVGSALLAAAEASVRPGGARALWLTTYGHLPWNRPFYERAGYVLVPEQDCGPDIRQELNYQRRWLPAPHERVAMRKPLTSGARDRRHGRTQGLRPRSRSNTTSR
jgi:GNAT superfamily N-acetyltransferase